MGLISSYLASTARFGAGMSSGKLGARPAEPLELYEFEGCPFCRKVREAITVLDLEVMIYPCPKNGPRFRKQAHDLGGRTQFPYLVDPNTGRDLYESADIVRYLFATYGTGRPPAHLLPILTTPTSVLASLARPMHGRSYRPSRAPERPLELYSFEASPYCRLAREALCELEIPYLLHSVGKGSPSRPAFIEKSGRMMVPYLVDPNTDTAMFESRDIVDYLYAQYAV